tara:strand:+ start:834 stop:1358 length:525 start_codon:yes stop_codon:yes gene_type:complete
MILGLDISTSITGVTVLDENGKTLCCKAWDLRKYKNFFEKTKETQRKLRELKTAYPDIESVYIEQSLQSFRPGFSSAKTLLTLARFNGIVSWLVYEMFYIEPGYIGASTARKLYGIKVPRGQKAKKVVLEFLLDNEEGFEIEYTKYGNPKPESYDRADSLVIARAGYQLCNKKN